MVLTADDFTKAGISVPMLVGGAALSSNFVDKQISKAYKTGFVAYAKDAMTGLDLAKKIVSPDLFKVFSEETRLRRQSLETANTEKTKVISTIPNVLRSSKINRIIMFYNNMIKTTINISQYTISKNFIPPLELIL